MLTRTRRSAPAKGSTYVPSQNRSAAATWHKGLRCSLAAPSETAALGGRPGTCRPVAACDYTGPSPTRTRSSPRTADPTTASPRTPPDQRERAREQHWEPAERTADLKAVRGRTGASPAEVTGRPEKHEQPLGC